MLRRISITNPADCDNSSDPAASASSSSASGSQNDNPASTSTPESSTHQPPVENERGSLHSHNSRNRSHTPNTPNTPISPTADDRFQERLDELRVILPDSSDAELREMLEESDRASRNTLQSAQDATAAAALTSAPMPPMSEADDSPRRSTASQRSSSSRRAWVPCQPAPSRPGVYHVGGAIESGVTFNVGVTDPITLEIKRIEAVSQVQDALNAKLGYNLRESGQYEEMERKYAEGEQTLASTGIKRREKKVLPTMKMWDAPPVSRQSMEKKEPPLSEPGEPLPLPLSFGGREEGMQNGGNGEICLGKFVDVAPNEDDDEEKREETLDTESWAGVSVDHQPMGPYEQVVRCWKCRAGLKVHIEVGLVACPRCRTISPATDIANIG